ncbi:hypothetical protein N7520_003373 [Penicillium odoratum]|uniref:uncharacterized protein n=1 Tax=Penicillium odoratum TaxID=1167516 RepID=UPI00254757AA|nr:uncharacterized protein N7520_003373 [Penicillium odoratum]KAJ5768814.1 hypothetical protein N7520_003373 [Penicillium odoratum]
MARLNDYTAPPESIEALKRRFVRQNKEIARVNSMQSLRIRSLESEVAHLLAENVSLRQQVINVTQEAERLEAAKMLHAGVYAIKSRLDAKIAELNDLALDLGMLPRKVGTLEKSDMERPKMAGSRPQPIDPDYPGVEDGKLPAILEDKCYPRRTLEPLEIQNVVQMDSSPAPPVFEVDLTQHPVTESPSPSPAIHEVLPESQLGNPPISDHFLPPTLETRKKKKRTDSVTPAKKDFTAEEQKPPVGDIIRPVKSGSKRKFSPDKDGALSDEDGLSESDEFQFSRPSQSPQRHVDLLQLMHQDPSPTKTPVSIKRGPATGTMKRKVLEPKSANVNFSSPKKARASLHSDNKLPLPIVGNENTVSPQKPKDLEKHRGRGLNQAARRPRPASDAQRERSFQPSMQSEQPTPTLLKDSPIVQSDIVVSVADAAATSRSSRRRGAVVSYAEPNLRDKMRRPTKELIDAVGRNGARRSSSFLLGAENSGEAGDLSQGEKPTSPCPQPNQIKANSDSTHEAIDMSSKDDASNQLLEAMSRRRQSRRHSSNPNSGTRDKSPPRHTSGNGEPQSPVWKKSSPNTSLADIQPDSSLDNDDFAGQGSRVDASYRRETRVAARRKSMMV